MLRSFIFAAIAVAFGVLASGSGNAQTPDGQTPAQEPVCDQLLGGTPGLYGLCVAYCEAQDVDEMIQEAMAGGDPGAKILGRYRAKMQPGDPDMPCIASATTCPCFDVSACDPFSGDTCALTIFDVSELFLGLSCNLTDSCRNGAGFAADNCNSSGEPPGGTAAIVRAFPSGGGACSVRRPTDTSTPGNSAVLDTATTQICLDQLNAYDGNGEGDPDVLLNCGLGRP